MTYESLGHESQEPKEYVPMTQVLNKLGQMQYVSRLINPSPKLHEDGTPYFDDIRIEGNPDNYYSVAIHKDDIRKFVEKWLEYKQSYSPLYKDKTVEDYL